MVGEMLDVIRVLLLFGLWCAALVGPIVLMMWWDPVEWWQQAIGTAVVVVCLLVVVAYGVVQTRRVINGGDDGVHRWDGGAGASTVCTYEKVTRFVGKVPMTATQTVCRDPR